MLRGHELRATGSISDENSIETTRTHLLGTLPGFSGVMSGVRGPKWRDPAATFECGDAWWFCILRNRSHWRINCCWRKTHLGICRTIISQTGSSTSIYSYWVLYPFTLRCWPELWSDESVFITSIQLPYGIWMAMAQKLLDLPNPAYHYWIIAAFSLFTSCSQMRDRTKQGGHGDIALELPPITSLRPAAFRRRKPAPELPAGRHWEGWANMKCMW